MSIWKPTDDDKIIVMKDWDVFECKLPSLVVRTRHVAGYNLSHGEGRVSNIIISASRANEGINVTTRNGRKYLLVGEPGMYNPDARYTLDRWIDLQKVENYVVVSDDFVLGLD